MISTGHFPSLHLWRDMTQKLTQAGFEARAFWDFTFPWFWLMRRMYNARVKAAPPAATDKDASTNGQRNGQRVGRAVAVEAARPDRDPLVSIAPAAVPALPQCHATRPRVLRAGAQAG
jgi:hypothetical protein